MEEVEENKEGRKVKMEEDNGRMEKGKNVIIGE